MVPEAASIVGEMIAGLVSAVLEACLLILAASVRPWRYLLSRTYRTKINAQHAQSHPFFKWWDLSWGFLVLLASVVIIATVVVLVRTTPSSQAVDPAEHQRFLKKIERAMVREFMKKRSDD